MFYFADPSVMEAIANSENAVGSTYAGLGAAAIPAAVIAGLFANGFCEELLYRGFILKAHQAAPWCLGRYYHQQCAVCFDAQCAVYPCRPAC